MTRRNLAPTLIVSNAWMLFAELTQDAAFVPAPAQGFDAHLAPAGQYRGVEVWNVWIRGTSGAVIADFGRVGVWRQYQPRLQPDSENIEIDGDLLLAVRAFDEESSAGLLSTNPSVRSWAGEGASDEDAIRAIRERVLTRLLEWFDVAIVEPEALVVTRLEEAE